MAIFLFCNLVAEICEETRFSKICDNSTSLRAHSIEIVIVVANYLLGENYWKYRFSESVLIFFALLFSKGLE